MWIDQPPEPREDVPAPLHMTVSELNRAVTQALQMNFSLLWVSGELSSLTRAASGHWYFTLNDAQARVRCIMYRQRVGALSFAPKEGDSVLARVQVSFYEPRGEFQLLVENLRPVGQGALYEAFLRLKARLQAEGLLDDTRKRPLPRYGLTVGIVTSPQAAALGDVIRAFQRRAPHVRLILYPTQVQGATAPDTIAQAIRNASRRAEADLLLLVRGGGSIDDLGAFNHETVARAMVESVVPIISGIGHESDVTIADLVADVRAATPTAAAELASAAFTPLARHLQHSAARLSDLLHQTVNGLAQRLDNVIWRLKAPYGRQRHALSMLPSYVQRMRQAVLQTRRQQAGTLQHLTLAHRAAPTPLLKKLAYDLLRQSRTLHRSAHAGRERAGIRHREQAGLLEALAPQRVLERGYTLVRRLADVGPNQLCTRVANLQAGDRLKIAFQDGDVQTVVENVMLHDLKP